MIYLLTLKKGKKKFMLTVATHLRIIAEITGNPARDA